jgi:uncharacterized protein YjdB
MKNIYTIIAILCCLCTTPIFAATISGGPKICIGIPLTLSIDTSGGTWSSSNPTTATIDAATGVITGISPGMVTISYNLPGFSFTTLIVVYQQPYAIVGSNSLCEGTTLGLTNSSSGSGTWTSSTTSVATIGTGSGVVSGIAAGTTTITYTAYSGCFTTRVETVNTTPSSIAGSSTLCVGTVQTLTSTPGGGTWSSSAPSVAPIGASSGVVNGSIGGSSLISYSLATGCRSTLMLAIANLPGTITGSLAICMGINGTLSSTTSGGTWSSGTTSVATIGSSTGVVTPVSTGTSTVTYSVSSGCTRTAIVTVNAGISGNTGNPTVCVGQTTTLANTTTGGTWSSSTTSKATVGYSSGIVTGVSAGTANISYRLGSGCSSITQVTVNGVPAAITGTTSVCIGNTITLSHPTSGGTWSSSNTATAMVDGASGVVTGITTGLVTITYTLSVGCYKTVSILVRPLPAGISGTMTLCPGAGAMLTDGTSGGTWSSSNTSIATVGSTTGLLIGVSAGNATITYLVTSTGCFRTSIATVNATPDAGTITGASAVDVGATIALTDAASGGTWSSSNTTIATVGSTGILAGVATGTANISYTVTNSCGTARATHIVTVNTVATDPITGTLTVCAGATTSLSDATTGGTWSSSNTGVATVGSASGIVTGVSAGTATITYALGSSFVTVVFTVNGVPDAGSITGASSVNVGGTITLSDTVGGGSWSSSDTSVAVVGSAGVVTGVAAGSVTISYTVSNGCGSVVAYMEINVHSASFCEEWIIVGGVCSDTEVGSPSIALDNTGRPFVAYYDIAHGGKATVKKYVGGEWTVVGSEGFSLGFANYISIVLDSSNVPYVVYADGSNDWKATVKKYDGSLWVNVGEEGFSDGYAGSITMAIDPFGSIYTTYYDGAHESKTTVKKFNGATWVTVGSEGFSEGSANWTSMAIDNAGTPCVAYQNWSPSGEIKAVVMRYNGSDWSMIGGGPVSDSDANWPSIVIDNMGTPYLSYADIGIGEKVTVKKYDGVSWTTVGSEGFSTGSASSISIKLDSSASPYVSYTDAAHSFKATVKRFNGTNWITVDTEGFTSGAVAGTCLAIDRSNKLYIAYGDGANDYKATVATYQQALFAGTITGPSSVTVGSTITLSDTISGGTWSSSDTSIAVVGSTGGVTGVAEGNVVISYEVSNECGSASATKVVTVNEMSALCTGWGQYGSSISSEVDHMSFVVDHDNNLLIAYSVWTGGASSLITVKKYNGVTWDTIGADGFAQGEEWQYISMDVDSANTPYLAFTDEEHGREITVKKFEDGVWSTVGMDGFSAVPGSYGANWVSLAISKHGVPFVTYDGGGANQRANVKKYNGSSWVSVGIENFSDSASVWNVIALDANDTVYVAYVDYGHERKITVQKFNGSAWIPLGIEGFSDSMASELDLAIDNSGTPYVSYGDAAHGSKIVVKKYNGSSWVSVGAEYFSVGGIWGGPSLVFDSLNTPFVSYSDAGLDHHQIVKRFDGIDWVSVGGAIVTADVSVFSQLQLDNNQTPYVSYLKNVESISGSPWQLKVMKFTDSLVLTGIAGTANICPSDTITLNDTTPGGTWTSDNTSVATVGLGTGIVTGISAGTVVITYSAGDCYVTAVVTVNPSPSAGTISGSSSVHTGSSTTFTSSVSGGVWLSSSTGIATVGATTGLVTGVSPGYATIYYSAANSCGIATASHGISVTGARPGYNDKVTDDNLFSVYPNPTSGILTILSGTPGTATIFTIDGRTIKQFAVGIEPCLLSLPEGIASGIYLLKFNGNNGSNNIVRLVYTK